MLKTKEEFISWAQEVVAHNAQMAPAYAALSKEIATFDPVAASLVQKNIAASSELCEYLKTKIEAKTS